VQNQIYTVSHWSQKTETRIAPTVNRKQIRGNPWNERDVNAGSTKSATHHGQQRPAVNEGKTLFNTAGNTNQVPTQWMARDKAFWKILQRSCKQIWPTSAQ